jgi:hypothetical protein
MNPYEFGAIQTDNNEYVLPYNAEKNKNYKGKMLHAKSKYDEAERTSDLLEIFTNRG